MDVQKISLDGYLKDFYFITLSNVKKLFIPLINDSQDEIRFKIDLDILNKVHAFFSDNNLLLSLVLGFYVEENLEFNFENVDDPKNSVSMFHAYAIYSNAKLRFDRIFDPKYNV